MADEQVMARVRLWWQRLDADTQMMFDKLYRTDPTNVLAVISDGELTDLDGATTLDEALTYATGASDEGPDSTSDSRAVPMILVKDGLVVVEPVAPDAGAGVTVRWTEVNEGSQSQGHLSSVAWFVDGAWVEPIEEVIAGPMATGDESQRTVSLVGVASGEHVVYVTANADGNVTGSGAVPAAGYGQMASTFVRVGGGAARPNDPESARFEGLRDASMYLSQAMQAVSDPSSLSLAAQGLYAFAGSLDTGGDDSDDRGRDSVDPARVVQRAEALEAVDAGAYAEGQRVWQRELLDAIDALTQVQSDPRAGGQAAYVPVMMLGFESFQLR